MAGVAEEMNFLDIKILINLNSHTQLVATTVHSSRASVTLRTYSDGNIPFSGCSSSLGPDVRLAWSRAVRACSLNKPWLFGAAEVSEGLCHHSTTDPNLNDSPAATSTSRMRVHVKLILSLTVA